MSNRAEKKRLARLKKRAAKLARYQQAGESDYARKRREARPYEPGPMVWCPWCYRRRGLCPCAAGKVS